MSSMTPFEGSRYLHSAWLLCPLYLLSLPLSLYLSLPLFARSNHFYNGLSALSHCWKDVLDEQLSKEPSCPSSVENESSLFRKVWLALDSCSTFTDRGTDKIAQSWDTFTGGMSNQGNRLFCIFSVFSHFGLQWFFSLQKIRSEWGKPAGGRRCQCERPFGQVSNSCQV